MAVWMRWCVAAAVLLAAAGGKQAKKMMGSGVVEKSRAAVRHILSEDEASLMLAKRLIEEGHITWGKAVEEFSTCPGTKSRGGLLGGDEGWVHEKDVIEGVDAIAFSSEHQVGEVHGPIKTQFGHHLVMVDDREIAGDKVKAKPQAQAVKKLGGKGKGKGAGKTGSSGQDQPKHVKPTKDKLLIRDSDDFYGRVVDSTRVVLVFFSRETHCEACTAFLPVWEQYEDARPPHPILTAYMNTNTMAYREIARGLSIADDDLPHVRLYTGKDYRGTVVASGEGVTLDQLEAAVKGATKHLKKSPAGKYRKLI